MKNEIFKKGDKVYHFVFGWGSVADVLKKNTYDVVFEDRESVTIPCKEIHLSFCKYDLVTGGLSHERPLELEVGKSYRSKGSVNMVINRIGYFNNYGFYDGGWVDSLYCYAPDAWREVSDVEVREALEKETIRRFGENWEDVKIVKSIGLMPDGDNEGRFDSRIFEDNHQGGWVVWNKNGCLFKKGVWAEKLEEPEFERPLYFELEKSSGFDLDGILNENIICNDPESFTEAIKRLVSEKLEELEFEPFQKVLVRDGQSSAWSIDLFSNMRGNCEYPYRCMTACWSQCIPYEGNEHLLGTTKSMKK